jgi:hypothetical protein
MEISIEEIRKDPESQDWKEISFGWDLTEDFIREFQDYVYWTWISGNQELSESFIREFKDKVNWLTIFSFQNLSEGFIIEFLDKLKKRSFLDMNEKIPQEVKDRIIAMKELL